MKAPSNPGASSRRRFLQMTAAGATTWTLVRSSRPSAAIEGPAVGCAVIGLGLRGREILKHLETIDAASVKAYCDVYPPYLRRGARMAPDAFGYEDYRKLLQERADVEAVVVATPTHLHRDVAIACLQAGKHVYCEAPMASTVEDASAIAREAKGSSKVFAVGLQNRYNPVYAHAGKFLKAQAVGRPVSEEGHWFENNSWRRAVGRPEFEKALNWKLDPEVSLGLPGEAGVHAFDNFLRFQTHRPTAVSAFGSLRKWRDGRTLPDTVVCVFEFADGYLARFEATLANSFRQRYYLMSGVEGTILLKDIRAWWFKEADAKVLGWEVYARREKIGDEEGIVLLANATKLTEQGLLPSRNAEEADVDEDPLYLSLSSFLASCRQGEPAECGYKEGYQSAVMAYWANRALSERRRLEIDPDVFEI